MRAVTGGERDDNREDLGDRTAYDQKRPEHRTDSHEKTNKVYGRGWEAMNLDKNRHLAVLAAILVLAAAFLITSAPTGETAAPAGTGQAPEVSTTSSSTSTNPEYDGTGRDIADIPADNPNKTQITRKYNLTLEGCASLEGFESVDCINEVANLQRNISICQILPSQTRIDSCKRHYALYTDEKACQVFQEDGPNYYYCIAEIALMKRIPQKCDILEDTEPTYYRSLCRLEYMFPNNGSTDARCDDIGEAGMRTYCKAIFEENKTLCGDLKDTGWGAGWLRGNCERCAGTSGHFLCRLVIGRNGTIEPVTP